MKWKINQLESALKNGAAALPGLLCVYGEDAGLAKDLAKKAAEAVAPDLNDPFGVDRFRVEDVLDNPTCLHDSLQTVSFTVSHKLVLLEGLSKDLPAAVVSKVSESILQALDVAGQGATLVFAAPGFEPKIAMIKKIEAHENAAGVRCFMDNSMGIKGVVQQVLAKECKKIAPDAMGFLCENLGNDRAVTTGELEKLCLYVGERDQVTLDDCLTTISAAPSVNAFKLCDAIGMRDRKKADEYLEFLKNEGADTTMMLAMVIRHMRRLLQAKEMMRQGESADRAMMSLKPPVFFGKDDFRAQLQKYPEKRLRGSLERLCDLQLESRQGSAESDLVISRGILALAF